MQVGFAAGEKDQHDPIRPPRSSALRIKAVLIVPTTSDEATRS